MNQAGVILCGGASRRMGRPKAWLDWAGEPLLIRVVRTVAVACDQVVVAAGPGQDLPTLPEGVLVVRDSVAHAGPVHGLSTALSVVSDGPFFLTGCDAPFLIPELIELLFESLGTHDAVVPMVGDQFQPLCAVYSTTIRGVVASMNGIGSLRAILDRIDVRTIDEATLRTVDPQLRAFLPINTPDDVAASSTQSAV